MALDLKIGSTQLNDLADLVIIDKTGVYTLANTGGWDVLGAGPNITINDGSVTTATLDIETPSGGTVSLDLMTTAIWQAITPYTSGTPFDASTHPDTLRYVLNDSVLGEDITDGVYTLTFTYSDGVETATEVFEVAVYGALEKTLFGIISQVPQAYVSFEKPSEILPAVTTLWSLYLGLLYQAQLADKTQFTTTLAQLTDLCSKFSITNYTN